MIQNNDKSNWCIFYLILFWALTLMAGTAFARNYPIRNFGKADGLPGGVVFSLCQDSRGYLWIGTEKGLCRYDGFTFQTITLPQLKGKYIMSVMEDRDRNIWAGLNTDGAVCIPQPGGTPANVPPGLKKYNIQDIIQDKNGHLWFGTTNGLLRYDGVTLHLYTTNNGLPHNRIIHLALDNRQNVWVSTRQGIAYLKDDRFHPFKLPARHDQSKHFTVFPDSRGRVWVGSQQWASCYENGTFTHYDKTHGLMDNRIVSFFETPDGKIGATTWEGIFIMEGGRFMSINTGNGLANDFVYNVLTDREGNTWAATHSGLSRIRTLNITNYSTKNNLPHNMVYNITRDKQGRTWAATANGLGCIAGGQVTSYTSGDKNKKNYIHALAIDNKGVLWTGSLKGLSYLENGQLIPHTEFGHIVFEMKKSKDGTIWIASDKGLFYMKEGKVERPPFEKRTITITSILVDSRDAVWYGSSGILHCRRSGKTCVYAYQNGEIAGAFVREMFEDSKGIIWCSTDQGLTRINNRGKTAGEKSNSPKITHFTTEDGLPDNTCNFILEDNKGHIWLGTENGMVKYDGHRFKTYLAKNHGLVSDYWVTGYKDSSGKFWLGSDHGVTAFYPPPFPPNTVPPPIYITDVKVMEKSTAFDQLTQLDYNQNTLRFNYAGICHSAPESVKYKYKIEGIEDDWKETTDSSIYLPYLPSGNFRFLVKAINNDGVESSVPAEAAFSILPPFWKTWWFQILVLMASISIPSLLLLWRHRRAREKADIEAKNRQLVMAQRMELMGNLAAGTVHDLKNLLSIILGYTRVVSRKFDKEDEEYEHVETIRNTASTAVQMSKQILSLARYPDQLPGAVELGELLEEILETLKITLPTTVNTDLKLPGIPVRFSIHPARFQQLVINLCQNAAHAMPQGGELTVSLSYDGDGDGKKILLEIRDTGTGIERDKLEKIFQPLFTTKESGKGTGLGLFVVDQIVKEHGGAISVDSQPGAGTAFKIRFPSAPAVEE